MLKKSNTNMTGGNISDVMRYVFTLIELLIVISIIAILAGMLLPTLNKARATARSAACQNQLKSFGTYLILYADEQGGWLPHWQSALADSWCWKGGLTTSGYVGYNADRKITQSSLYRCPAFDSSETYWYLGYGVWTMFMDSGSGKDRKLSQIKQSHSRIVYMADNGSVSLSSADGMPWYISSAITSISSWAGFRQYKGKRHNNSGNKLFLDGHVGRFRTLGAFEDAETNL